MQDNNDLYEGRKPLLKTLVGSYNYNLNTEGSDKDYKIFIAPTFDDLYSKITFNNQVISDAVDIVVHDVRKISDLLYKSNINFMEILFSKEIEIYGNEKTKALFNSLFELKEDIVRRNLSVLYNACIGMYYTRMKLMFKGTKGTQELVDKYGYDTKEALHCYRTLDFLERYAETNFESFEKAIWYEDDDPKRALLLSIKMGGFTYEEFERMIDDKLLQTKNTYEQIYNSQKVNEDIKDFINQVIKDIVKINLFE